MIVEGLNHSQSRVRDVFDEDIVVSLFDDKFGGVNVKEFLDALKICRTMNIQDTPTVRFFLERDKRIIFVQENNRLLVTKVVDYDYGDINKWSFVIITRGLRDHVLLKSIESIKKQNIPCYEIIVVGGENKNYGNDVIYVPFMVNDEKGWITRKKNVGCEMAKYRNIAVIHDDMVLGDDWFVKLKEWGNNWEFCNMSIVSNPTLSWFAEVGGKNIVVDIGDIHPEQYIGGHCIMIKKFVWEQVKWDENLYWGEREDVCYSQSLRNAGFVLRISPASVNLVIEGCKNNGA